MRTGGIDADRRADGSAAQRDAWYRLHARRQLERQRYARSIRLLRADVGIVPGQPDAEPREPRLRNQSPLLLRLLRRRGGAERRRLLLLRSRGVAHPVAEQRT